MNLIKDNLIRILIYVIIISGFMVSCANIPFDKAVDAVTDQLEKGRNNDKGGSDRASNQESSGDDDSQSDAVSTDDSDVKTEPLDMDIPADRYFVGTFEKKYVSQSCSAFPEITRMYTSGEEVYIENNRSDLIVYGKIFKDNSFDFDIDLLDSFGNPTIELGCTCLLNDNQWYGLSWECSCESDNGFKCGLDYEEYL